MAKKSAVERLKEVVTGKKAPAESAKASAPAKEPAAPIVSGTATDGSGAGPDPAAKDQPAAKRDNVKNYQSGLKAKGSKAAQAATDPLLANLTACLAAKGLTVKAEKAHHTNITVLKEGDDTTTQISVQCGEALNLRDLEEIERRATVELLGE